jgi:hypothetical protein
MALARHTGDSAVIGRLVHVSIESDAIDGLSDHLARFSGEELDYLESRLDRLPPAPSLADGFRLEQDWIAQELEQGAAVDMDVAVAWAARFHGVLDDMSEDELQQAVDLFGRVSETHFATLRSFVDLPDTREETHELMERLLHLEAVRSGDSIINLDGTIGLDPDAPGAGVGSVDVSVKCQAFTKDAIALADRPLGEMLAAAPALDEAIANSQPLVRNMLANFTSVMQRHAGFQVRQQLLRAAVAVLRVGDDALARFPDPVTGASFRLSRDGDKLTFRSSFNDGRGELKLVAQRQGSAVPALPTPGYMKKMHEELKALRSGHFDNPNRDPNNSAAFDKFYGDMEKRGDTVLTHLDQNEADKRDAMLDLLMTGAFDFIDTWEAILAEALEGDSSAFVAAAIIQRTKNIEASLIHHTLQDRREDLEEIIGESSAEELIFLVGERRRAHK